MTNEAQEADPRPTLPCGCRAVLVAAAALILLVLVAFAGSRLFGGQRQINRVSRQLPSPPKASLFFERTGENQGSQDSCHRSYHVWFYESDATFESVASHYESMLDSVDWERIPSELHSWQRDEYRFVLKVWDLSDERLTEWHVPHIAEARAKAGGPTVYCAWLTHADWIARRWCPCHGESAE